MKSALCRRISTLVVAGSLVLAGGGAGAVVGALNAKPLRAEVVTTDQNLAKPLRAE